VRAYAVETTAVNIRDWASVFGFPLSPAVLAAVDVPALVMWGARSHPAVRRANELLSRCLKGAARAPIDGAAHFMISTHAPAVARLVGAHIDRAAAEPMPPPARQTAIRQAAMA
jgi:pimeloyl-ACP methyl ester carboxylesterase